MFFDEDEIQQIIQYLRTNYKQILQQEPEQVVSEVMEAVREYDKLAKLYLRMNWDLVKHYIAKPMNALEELRKRDPQLYNELIKHPKWLNRFFKKLYEELKKFIQ